jgi:signal transduction histidine kinase
VSREECAVDRRSKLPCVTYARAVTDLDNSSREDKMRLRLWVPFAVLAAFVLAPSIGAAPAKEVRRILILNEVNSTYQALSHELHSSKLEYLGAIGGMKSWCNEFGERRGLQIEFKGAESKMPLPPEVGLCLFRVLQEALNNAAKHSGARRIEVQLREDSGEIHLAVSDAGKGFDVETAMQGRGLGLASMQERLRLVGGELSVESQPKGGAIIHARVPLSSAGDAMRAAG